MTPFHLNGKTILITGASSGIGSQTAARITEMGGLVVLSGRDAERLEATKKLCIPGSATIITGDLC